MEWCIKSIAPPLLPSVSIQINIKQSVHWRKTPICKGCKDFCLLASICINADNHLFLMICNHQVAVRFRSGAPVKSFSSCTESQAMR